jgi:hypothetical protein
VLNVPESDDRGNKLVEPGPGSVCAERHDVGLRTPLPNDDLELHSVAELVRLLTYDLSDRGFSARGQSGQMTDI